LKHVAAFLKDLAVAPAITHHAGPAAGARTRAQLRRGLLTEDHRDVVRRYIRWHLQRRMNQMESVPQGTFLRSKQTVTVAIGFLNWLHDHGVELDELRQDHLDAWLADGPSTRRFVTEPCVRQAAAVRVDRSITEVGGSTCAT